jgi:hypothetical protein
MPVKSRKESAISNALRYALGLTVWGLLTYGVLSLRDIPMEGGDSLCGVWGCLPRLEALLAYHGFCIMLAIPAVWLLASNCSPRCLAMTGKCLILLALADVAAITGYEAVTWLENVPEAYRQYFGQRVVFVIVSKPSFGIAPLTLSGAACWIAGSWKRGG